LIDEPKEVSTPRALELANASGGKAFPVNMGGLGV